MKIFFIIFFAQISQDWRKKLAEKPNKHTIFTTLTFANKIRDQSLLYIWQMCMNQKIFLLRQFSLKVIMLPANVAIDMQELIKLDYVTLFQIENKCRTNTNI